MTYNELLERVKAKMAENPVVGGTEMDEKTIVRYWIFATLPTTWMAVAEVLADRPDFWEQYPWYGKDKLVRFAHAVIQKQICRDLGVYLDSFDAPEDHQGHTEPEEKAPSALDPEI